MSRILVVADDDRLTTWEACWWRLVLPTNESGYYAVTQIDIPQTAPVPPWAGHIDYFDSRNDWSWPYRAHVETDVQFEDDYPDCDITLVRSLKYYLDVLDSIPPDVSEGSRWLQLTEPGNDRHPSEREIRQSWNWPRHRESWIVGYCTSFELSFMG